MEFLLILQKRWSFDSVSCWNLQFAAWRISTFAQFHIYGHGQIRLVDCAAQHADPHTEWFLNSKGIIHCCQRGQPSHAAFEGEGRIVLH